MAFVIAVGHEAQRQREAREHQRPRVQVSDRPPAAEADPRHPVMEVLAVGSIDRLPVLQPLEHHEGRVEERHGQQDQRQHERHDRGCLDGCLDRDDAHQQPQQLGSAVAHEARGRREVEEQEPERRSGRHGRQDGRLLAAQVERDDGHGRGDDGADAGRQPVDSVGEVDDVHHHDQPEHAQDRTGVSDAGVGEVHQAHEWQRDRLDGHAEVDDDDRREHLAGELDRRRQVEAVVEGAHQRDDARTQQHPVPELMVLSVARRKPHEHGHEGAGEDGQAAEQGRRAIGEAASARLVDHARSPRDPHRQRRQQRGHGRCEEERVKRFELGRLRHRLAHSIAGAEVAGWRLRACRYTLAAAGMPS